MNFILRENYELEKELDELNGKVKSMHSNWYRDRKNEVIIRHASALLAEELVFEGVDVHKDEISECVLQHTDTPVI